MQINFLKCLLSQNFGFFDEYLQIHLQKNKLPNKIKIKIRSICDVRPSHSVII